MAQCLAVGVDLVVSTTSPPCTGTALVALTVDEFQNLSASPFYLSVEDGADISFAIIGVWLVAVVTRAFIRALQVGDPPGSEGEI